MKAITPLLLAAALAVAASAWATPAVSATKPADSPQADPGTSTVVKKKVKKKKIVKAKTAKKKIVAAKAKKKPAAPAPAADPGTAPGHPEPNKSTN